jgi:glycine C-acetyltransferase
MTGPSGKKTAQSPSASLRQVLLRARTVDLETRATEFKAFWESAIEARQSLYFREVLGPADREVAVRDPFTGETRQMLMFGSNNYLGFANDPYIRERVAEIIKQYGTGLGGPPMLNGYTSLLRELEERLADLKGTESAVVFPTGYQTNLGLISCLMDQTDLLLFDESHHASTYDGVKLSRAAHHAFSHNDVAELDSLLAERREGARDTFVYVEGVYSMDGDLAPLPDILSVCRKHSSWLIVDDAHGTGVLGEKGKGAAEHFDLEGQIDLVMGTFSKTLAAVGGFIAGPANVIAYIKFFARSYMFSAALPPVVLATVMAGLDLLDREPERVAQLHSNVSYMVQGFRSMGLDVSSESAVIPVLVPRDMHIRKATCALHERNMFINAIEWPAVPSSSQRFRVSLMSTHTREDLDRAVEAFSAIWADESLREKEK